MNTTQSPLTFHVGIAPYRSANGDIIAIFELLNSHGEVAAVCEMRNGKVHDMQAVRGLNTSAFLIKCHVHFRSTPPIIFGTSTHSNL